MPTKRELLAHLARDELKDIVDHFELKADARSPTAMLEAVAASREGQLTPILGGYLRERLAELCEALSLGELGQQTGAGGTPHRQDPGREARAEASIQPTEKPAKQAKPAEHATTPRSQRGR